MEIINKTLLGYLFNYPEMCIYGLINSKDHKIYIGYTSNLPSALSRIIKETKDSNNKLKHDWNKLELVILETITDRKNLRVRHKFYNNEYSNRGWVLYNKGSNLTSYKLRLDAINNGVGKDLSIHVKLISRRYREIVVGIFNTHEEALNWCLTNYPDNSNITNIVYSDVSLCK